MRMPTIRVVSTVIRKSSTCTSVVLRGVEVGGTREASWTCSWTDTGTDPQPLLVLADFWWPLTWRSQEGMPKKLITDSFCPSVQHYLRGSMHRCRERRMAWCFRASPEQHRAARSMARCLRHSMPAAGAIAPADTPATRHISSSPAPHTAAVYRGI